MEDSNLIRDLKDSIMKVLADDGKPMTYNFLMHRVFKNMQTLYPSTYINQKDFAEALQALLGKYWVERNKFNKYYVGYLDYEETEVSGEGYLEVDLLTGNGYITVKRDFREYKKASHFVHKKNLNGAKCGDYVKFQELNNTNNKSIKSSLKDAIIKDVLPRPSLM